MEANLKATRTWRERLCSYEALAPLVVLAVFFFADKLPPIQKLQNLALNYRIIQRHDSQPPPDSRLCFVMVDDTTVSDFQMRWPFPRLVHAQLMNFIAPGKPGVMVWDVLFDSPTDEENDAPFVQVIQDSPYPIIVGTAADTGDEVPADFSTNWPEELSFPGKSLNPKKEMILPFPELRKVAKLAATDAPPDSDGVIRKMPLIEVVNGQVVPSLSLGALMTYWKIAPEQVRVVLGDAIYIDSGIVKRRIPIDGEGNYTVNYRYETDSFQAFNYSRLLKQFYLRYQQDDRSITPPDIQDKILLVGQSGTAMSDIGPSPLSGQSPRPLMHLNIMDNILKEDYLKTLPKAWVWLGFLVLAYGTLIPLRQTGLLLKIGVPILILGLWVGASFWVFTETSTILPVVVQGMAFLLLHVGAISDQVIRERRERQKLKQTFSAYVAPGILESIYKNPQSLQLGGANKEVSILFSDVRSFTSMTEEMDSTQLVSQLNEYFTEMVECINRYTGTLHKYIGDAIMAVWGDVTDEGPTIEAGQALRAAIDMRQALIPLNRKWVAEGKREFHMGIGINHGRVVVGNIGAPQRMEFTVIGDAVNLASRIEGLSKKFGVEIVIGQSVYDLTHERFVFRSLSKVRVAGKSIPVKVYEPLYELGKEDQCPYDGEWLRLYEEAYARFEEGRYDVAVRLFEACQNTYPDDKTTQMLLDLCRELAVNPPPEDWDGAFAFDSK